MVFVKALGQNQQLFTFVVGEKMRLLCSRFQISPTLDMKGVQSDTRHPRFQVYLSRVDPIKSSENGLYTIHRYKQSITVLYYVLGLIPQILRQLVHNLGYHIKGYSFTPLSLCNHNGGFAA